MKNGHVFNPKLSVLPTFEILKDMDINVKNRDFPRPKTEILANMIQ